MADTNGEVPIRLRALDTFVGLLNNYAHQVVCDDDGCQQAAKAAGIDEDTVWDAIGNLATLITLIAADDPQVMGIINEEFTAHDLAFNAGIL